MNDANTNGSSAIIIFRELHESGCFVLPNPWDAGSAVYLEHLGFKALATTSAGFSFSRALPDSVSAVSRGLMLAHISEIVEATHLPVNADFQTGYAVEPDGVAASVALCVATGVAGEEAQGTGITQVADIPQARRPVVAAAGYGVPIGAEGR